MNTLPETPFDFYIVGGYVRDKLLRINNNDVDYLVVPNDHCISQNVFDLLCKYLINNNYVIIQKKEEHLCIKTKNINTKQINDFVLARKDIYYPSLSRRPQVVQGTLYDDLIRRDFTINSLAINVKTNEIVDVCDGQIDLRNKILRTPIDPKITLLEDPLRILRGFRFSVTHGFTLCDEFMEAIKNKDIWSKFYNVVSVDRIREEFNKMFSQNTPETLNILCKIKEVNCEAYSYIFTKIVLKAFQIN